MAVVILENGAYSSKTSYSSDAEPRIVPNCISKAKNVRTRIFIGDQVEDCKDMSGLYYLLPFQKGYLLNWDIERQIWDHIFGNQGLKVDFTESSIVFTEPVFNFQSIQEALNEIFFEEYQFKSVLRTNASSLSQYKHQRELQEKCHCCLVVDSGYSFTHIIPYFDGKKVHEGIKRIDVGGKLLTNHLKEVISYRQLMVMDETHVINQMKEDSCYVSCQFLKDMDNSRLKGKANTVVRDYVLPDYTHIKRGYMKSHEESTGKAKESEQIIRMGNERFAIPEILFRPSDVGIQEMGIPEAICHAIESTPLEMHFHLYKNILLTGGNCSISGFKDRVYQDVRAQCPDEYEVNVHLPDNPITYAWEGGKAITKDPAFKKMIVTREEYDENGQNICRDTFDV